MQSVRARTGEACCHDLEPVGGEGDDSTATDAHLIRRRHNGTIWHITLTQGKFAALTPCPRLRLANCRLKGL